MCMCQKEWVLVFLINLSVWSIVEIVQIFNMNKILSTRKEVDPKKTFKLKMVMPKFPFSNLKVTIIYFLNKD